MLLLVSHTTLNTYVPNFALNLIAIAFTSLLSILYARHLSNEYQIALLFYVMSHFVFANYQGGLQNLVFFFVLVFSGKISLVSRFGHPMILAVILVFTSHLLGVATKSVSPITDVALGTISLISYMSIFLVVSSIRLSKKQFGMFLTVTTIMMTIMLLSQLNSRYGLFVTKSPIVGYSPVHHEAGRFFRSMMGASPGTAEFAFMNLVVAISFMSSIRDARLYGVNRMALVYLVFASASVMLLTTNRSTVFLTIAALGLLFIPRLALLSAKTLRTALIMCGLLVFVYSFKTQLGLNYLSDRLLELQMDEVSIDSIESGEAINRGTAFDIGEMTFKRENWLVGYGWSTYNYNRFAWFGSSDHRRQDLHSLYFTLPVHFGWLGSIAFLLIVASPTLSWLTRKRRRISSLQDIGSLSNAFVIVNVLFMINQVKQGFVTSPNYFFIIMFWTGIAVSINTYGLSEN
ncbi:MAG: hypothetical protein PHC39_08005 [Proteiniphilum sp.]|nr:hypothetical protein [Proteiniphilum sp.]